VGFGPPVTPPIVKNLLIANGVIFVLQMLTGAQGQPVYSPLVAYGAVFPDKVFQFVWQPFTYMWLHASFMHVAFNMLALWMFGSAMALAWGPQRFLRYYLACGVGAGVIIALWPHFAVAVGMQPESALGRPTLGASGAVFGVLLAYAITWPDRYIMLLFPPIPIKAIYFIPFILFMEYVSGPRNVSHVGHLGGVLVGWILMAREGRTQGLLSINKLKYRWRRWRMRQKLHAVREEERRWQERRDRNGRGPLH
jgi:membrane associated rhomboid family serine protease